MRLNPIRLAYATVSIAVIASFVISYFPVLAQDVTPAPPRTRRAYSTMDYYNLTHGGDTGSNAETKKVKKVKRVRKPKPASVVKPHFEDKTSKTESSESSSTSKVSETSTTNSTKNETKSTNSGSKPSDISESATGATKKRPNRAASPDTLLDAAAPYRDEAVVANPKDPEEKPQKSVEKPDADLPTASKQISDAVVNRSSVDLPATKLSSIPPPQMPPPPTSIGGFQSKGSAK
jgi:hypothetical protein